MENKFDKIVLTKSFVKKFIGIEIKESTCVYEEIKRLDVYKKIYNELLRLSLIYQSQNMFGVVLNRKQNIKKGRLMGEDKMLYQLLPKEKLDFIEKNLKYKQKYCGYL